MLRLKGCLVILGLLLAGFASAEESEFKGKLQEDLNGYLNEISSKCGITVKADWTGGKLGSNPRETTNPEWTSISTLCTSGMDGVTQACEGNEVVKKALKSVKAVQCTKGKGTIGYGLKGGVLTLTVDPSFTKNNAAGQTADLVVKMKKELDT